MTWAVIVDIVWENNAVRLKEDNGIFENIASVSLSIQEEQWESKRAQTPVSIGKDTKMFSLISKLHYFRCCKHSFWIIQRILELEANEMPHSFVYVDEAGLIQNKVRRSGRSIIGQRATKDVAGRHGGNITICAGITDSPCWSCWVLQHRPASSFLGWALQCPNSQKWKDDCESQHATSCASLGRSKFSPLQPHCKTAAQDWFFYDDGIVIMTHFVCFGRCC